MKRKLKNAISEINNGKMNDALQILNEIISKDGNNFEAYIYRGKAKRKLYDFQGALEDYNTAVTLYPERAEVYNNRAKLFYSVCSFRKALQDIKKANELYPESALILFNKGNIESKLNLFQDALESYSKAIFLDPFFLFAYIKRGLLKEKTGDYNGAMDDYAFVIKSNKKCTKAFYYRDRLLVNIKKVELKGKMELLTSDKTGVSITEIQISTADKIRKDDISRAGKSEKIPNYEKMQSAN
jgi:tetratricopeptide (TPR) repeat protein